MNKLNLLLLGDFGDGLLEHLKSNFESDISHVIKISAVLKYEEASQLTCNELTNVFKSVDLIIIHEKSSIQNNYIQLNSVLSTYQIKQSFMSESGPIGILGAYELNPKFVNYGKIIQKYSPMTFVINLTSPFDCTLEALNLGFKGVKAINFIHDIENAFKFLNNMISSDDKMVSNNCLKTSFVGVSNLYWLSDASIDNQKYYKIIEKHIVDSHQTKAMTLTNEIAMSVYSLYHYLPFSNNQTLNAYFQSRFQSEAHEQSDESNYEKLVPIIEALFGYGNFIYPVSMINVGQINEFPNGRSVLTNAYIRYQFISPILEKNFPLIIQSMTQNEITKHQLIEKAFQESNLEYIYQAILIDRLALHLDYRLVIELVDKIIHFNET